MQQYYTLEEAAGKLQMSPDELREMAKKKQIRAFQDRGSWRFRAQEIEEMARARGLGSDAELQLGEAAKAAAKTKAGGEDLLPADFNLDEVVPIGREKPADKGAKTGSKSGPRSPAPRAGDDSPVRLVMDQDLSFPVDPSEPRSGTRKAGDSDARKAQQDRPSDSDVKVVPDTRDPAGSSKMKSPSDSDIRLQDLPSATGRRKGESNVITEEIDLDAEEAKAKEQAKPAGGKSKPTKAAAANPPLPSTSPFELSESDFGLEAPPAGPPTSKPAAPPTGKPTKAKKTTDSSSDFELVAFDSTKSPGELGSGDIPLLSDEEVSLGEVSGPAAGNSGINLQDPADSGISLEQGGSDELEFELSLDAGSTTPKPTPEKDKDSSSDFELSLDDSSEDNSSSEFELSLDDSGDDVNLQKVEPSSDSEFELTLDDEGGLAVEEEAKDIFEDTSFDVPALEDDSGSEAVPLGESDTDLEGSDFEISLDDDSDPGDRTESQVVTLDEEEEADETAGTVVKPKKKKSKTKVAAAALEDEPALDEEGLDLDLDRPAARRKAAEEEDLEEEEEEPVVAAAPAEWGPIPAILLFPTVIVMFVVCIMGFELVQSMFAYHRPTTVGKPVINAIARQFDDSLPKD